MSSPATPAIDFSRVQYPDTPQPEAKQCHYCSRGLEGEYYKLQGEDACGVCVENVRGRFPADTHKAFSQALLWGIPAAVLGMIGYAAFEILTGIEIGFVAIGVAWLISKAMLRGSGGARGRRYQITAVLLTYAAVAVAFIPLTIAAELHLNGAKVEVAGSADGTKKEPASEKVADTSEQHGMLYSIGLVLGLGLISPFYELFTSFGSGAIGLFILFWGMQYAWKAMAAPKVDVDGPFAAAVS